MPIPSLFDLGNPGYLGIKKLTVGTTVVAHATSSNWATPADVVLNKQFIDASGALGTGTLENFGPLQTITVTAGTTATQLTAATSYRGFATITINPTPSMAVTTTSSATLQTIVAATGKLLSQVIINPIATVTRANTNMTATVNSTNNTITITAGNNQTTGYVTGSNATAQATVSLTINTPTLDTTTGKVVATAKAQFNNGATISKTSASLNLQLATCSSTNNIVNITQGYLASAATIAIPTVARANTNLTTSTTTNGLVITASNNQGTGYVAGSNATAQKTISLNIGNPTINENGVVTAIATISDNSTSPITQISKNATLNLGKGSATVSGKDVTISAGYYSSATTLSIATVTRANTSLSSTINGSRLIINASNNQGTGYVVGSNATAQKTISLTTDEDEVTASDGTNSITVSVGTVSRANTTITVTASNNKLLINTSNNQATGYVIGSNATNSKEVTLTIGTPVLDANGKVRAVATITDNSSTPVKISRTSATLTLPSGSVSTNANIVTVNKGYYTATTTVTLNEGAQRVSLLFTPGNGNVSVVSSNVSLTATTSAPASGYYITAKGSGGVSATSVASIATSGYLAVGSTSTMGAATSNTATQYYTLPSGDVTISGGTLTKGVGSVSATGTNIGLTATTTKPTSGHYITASGFGRVNRSDITKTNTPGYISATTATVLASTSEVSNVATVYYTISTEEKTVTASTTAQVVEPSNGKLISKITINAIPVYDGSLEVQ